MTQEEQLQQAFDAVAKMKKDVEDLKALDLESAFQTGGPRTRRGSAAAKVQHGEVIIKVKDGLLRARDGETLLVGPVIGPPPELPTAVGGVDQRLYRTVTPMRSKHQRTMINKIWKYRNFKKCGVCGGFDTYKTRNLDDTNGVEIWCYQCGAKDDEVLQEYQPAPQPKFKQRECADCGNQMFPERGERIFPTGETDPSTGRLDCRCVSCKKIFDAANEKEKKA